MANHPGELLLIAVYNSRININTFNIDMNKSQSQIMTYFLFVVQMVFVWSISSAIPISS